MPTRRRRSVLSKGGLRSPVKCWQRYNQWRKSYKAGWPPMVRSVLKNVMLRQVHFCNLIPRKRSPAFIDNFKAKA